MLKNIVLLITAFVCAQVFAEPMKMASKAELASAKKAAEGLLSSSVSADQVFEYAEEAKKSAEKYQLYCTAFKLYAKEEKAEEAAKVISTIQTEFIGAPDKDIVSMIEQYAKKLAKDNEELGAALSVSKMRASASSQLSKAKKELKKNPNSVEHKYLIAESHAVLGDWKAALKQFKDAGGTVWQVASEELSGDVSAKIAAFWWDYKPHSKFNTEPVFKAHSAAIYEKLLKDGELSVLEKATAESRIEQAGHLGATKPKSELDKLKKICNTNGLMHCWRFNGDLKDAISGGREAVLRGNSIIKNGQVVHNIGHNNIDLGANVLPREGNATIEFWTTYYEGSHAGRMFVFGSDRSHRIAESWVIFGKEDELYVDAGKGGVTLRPAFGPFEEGVEYHMALVIENKGDDRYEMTAYRQNSKTGDTISKRSILLHNGWNLREFEHKDSWLGGSYWNDRTSASSYNEVRIWNRALSEEELTKNAIKFHKAGETMKK